MYILIGFFTCFEWPVQLFAQFSFGIVFSLLVYKHIYVIITECSLAVSLVWLLSSYCPAPVLSCMTNHLLPNGLKKPSLPKGQVGGASVLRKGCPSPTHGGGVDKRRPASASTLRCHGSLGRGSWRFPASVPGGETKPR